MKYYIDKATLVAEIKKLNDEAKIHPSDFGCGRLSICKELIKFLDTLGTKEVDLEKEIDKEIETRWRGEYLFTSKFRESAKHFFELGLKAKGE